MKKYILILLVISNITMLSANENISVELICSKTKDIVIKINSDKLNLTNDAIQDNLGGYVDIPATNYYIKTNNKLYHLNGVVDNLNQDNINQFSSIINTNSKNLINPKQLYSLKNNEDLKFIQKIDLESNNNTESLKN
ncbi:MAG: hypothetical protein U9R39_05610, partial [Campylobacterota bacterium]|nr:hypothetical protein [Campylobacterota bacterium]